jgi:hypothetical protein
LRPKFGGLKAKNIWKSKSWHRILKPTSLLGHKEKKPLKFPNFDIELKEI